MSKEDYFQDLLGYWQEKAYESLDSAEDEMKAGRFSFSVNRLYYACFYMISTALLQEKLQFRKHSAVRAAFHKHFVKTGLVSRDYGKLYDELFEARQRGDYIEFVRFEEQQIKIWFQRSQQLVETLTSLIKSRLD